MADLHVKYNTANNHIVRISAEPIAVTEVGFALAKLTQTEREENGQTVYNVKPGDEIAFYMSANGVDEDGYITDYSTIRQAPEAQYMLDTIARLEAEKENLEQAIAELTMLMSMPTQ